MEIPKSYPDFKKRENQLPFKQILSQLQAFPEKKIIKLLQALILLMFLNQINSSWIQMNIFLNKQGGTWGT